MIVTRRRRKKFPWRRLLLPIVAIALLVAALEWAPSRNWIANGPLSVVWRTAAPVVKPIAAPFEMVGAQRTISAQNSQIATLQKQLADAHSQIGDRDKQNTELKTELNAAQTQAVSAHAAAPTPAAAQATNAPSANDLAAGATPDMQRTAAVWSAMDAEAAAKVVQRLPVEYVARIFALMSPDSVGAILENLPPTYAARLTRDHPGLQH